MPTEAFSDDWAAQFKDQINSSAAYRESARGWRWTVGLVVEAEPDRNFQVGRGVVLDLYEGEARAVQVTDVEAAQDCSFVISAPYSRWKQVAQKELDPTRGMLQGKLRLKGNLPTIVRYNKAARELTECTSRIDVAWPDDRL
ncbi:MAG: SCP2 sterol-binding domain-containing protein [Candidatus Dormibacteraceae bacterium]